MQKLEQTTSHRELHKQELKGEKTIWGDIVTVKPFQREISEELKARPHAEEVEIEWAHIEAVMKKVAEKVIGYSERKVKNKWFDEHCKKALQYTVIGYSERKVKNKWFDEHCKKALQYTGLKTMEAGNEENKKEYQEARRAAKKYTEGQDELI
ncbi:hypothetical protein QE152_g26967 [Popillia japonica]|uniref:Uncharacterized protein n=1 Tax=Popillia japonica TaxID=7064 RepID=A0AAW1JVA7_POPJA